MTDTGYDVIKNKRNELIRKGLNGSAFISQYGSTAITQTNLFDPTSGDLVALPEGWDDVGWLTDDGVKFSRDVTATDTTSWGSTEPTRVDITKDTATAVLECQETKLATMGLYLAQDLTGLEAAANGSVSIKTSGDPSTRFYRGLFVAVDDSQDGEFVIAYHWPRTSVSDYADQSFANGDDPVTWGVTLTRYIDNNLGYAQDLIIGGAGFKTLADEMGVVLEHTVTCTTVNSEPGLVATNGSFSEADEGAPVTGAGIPNGTTILEVADATHATMSANATASGTNVAVTVG